MNQLQKIEAFRYELAVAETYDEIKELDTKIAAIQEFARRNKVSKEKQDEIGVFRIEIEQKKGAWLDEFFPHGGDVKSEKSSSNSSSLKDVGVTYNESANARLMAKEREEVNQVIEDLKKNDRKVITPNAVQSELRKRKKQEDLQRKKEEIKTHESSSFKIDAYAHHTSYSEYLSTVKDGSFDLLITDPPYSTDVDNINDFVNNWVFDALKKVNKTGRAYICIGAYPKEIQAYFNAILKTDFIFDSPLIWTYRNTLGNTPKMKYNLNYQMILHLYQKDSEPLDTSITNEMFSVQDINAPDGRQGNRFHTWQKPSELARRLITHSTREGDFILDPFCGSGTFLVESAKLGRNSVGCDIDKKALEICKERGVNVQW